jgi:acetolactate synthase I/II/III large subunit
MDDPSETAATIIAELEQARRPLILAGNGVRAAKAVPELRAFIEAARVPVVSSRKNGIDLFPIEHPLYFGRPGALAHRYANFAVQTADLIVVLGCRLDLVQVAYDWRGFGRHARKGMVDIDAHEIEKIHPPVDRAFITDVGPVIRGLIGRVGDSSGLSKEHDAERERWLARCQRWKAAYPVVQQRHRELSGAVSTYVLAEELGHRLDEVDTMVIGSSGASIEIFMLAYSAPRGQRAFLTGGLGAMGFGLPASIGACLASRGRTILVDGDGGFQLNVQELATLRRLSLPVKIFVLDNHGYGSIRTMQRRHFQGRLVGSDAGSGLALPDVVRLAASYGIRTARATGHRDLPAILDEVLAGDDPVVCTVAGDEFEVPEPRVTSKVLPDGSMVSRPLEDLEPLIPPEELDRVLSE